MSLRKFHKLKQPTSEELIESCLNLIRSKFYGKSPQEDRAFSQDRTRLLKWVVLFPAAWLDERRVTIHGDKYREIFMKVFLQAAGHVETKVRYRPAYLRQVIESHFAMHGEEYYEEAKSVRTLADQTLLLVGKLPAADRPDPVRQMANAAQLLKGVSRSKKPSLKVASERQQNFIL